MSVRESNVLEPADFPPASLRPATTGRLGDTTRTARDRVIRANVLSLRLLGIARRRSGTGRAPFERAVPGTAGRGRAPDARPAPASSEAPDGARGAAPLGPDALDRVELPPMLPLGRRLWKYRWLDQYKRLLALVAVTNLAVLGLALTRWDWFAGGAAGALAPLSTMITANLAVAVVFRQQHVINLLFAVATSLPRSWPLALRAKAAKVYHFGGLHSGCASAATLWFLVLVGVMVHERVAGPALLPSGLLICSIVLAALLVGIVAMAMPGPRARFHDAFEATHRLGGWSALALFWVQTVLFVDVGRGGTGLGEALLASGSVWTLAFLTASIALPWTRLRKVPVSIERPSSHVAISRFDYGVTPFAGSSMALSTNPLLEWHSFANVPSPSASGYRLTISRAGDWTGRFIDEAPEKVWVKGVPTAGVGNVDQLFRRVVWVATGSGIGPCLPHLLSGETPAQLVWSTRSPRKTYGDTLVDEILAAQPNAIIWDTDELGKPDMLKLSWLACRRFDAEAVICIANQKLTRQVVFGMESRGVPAYGAIWDS